MIIETYGYQIIFHLNSLIYTKGKERTKKVRKINTAHNYYVKLKHLCFM